MSIKFSQLPPVDTPLAGDELVCVVQDGVSKQATASDFGSTVVRLGGEKAFVAALGVNNNVAFGATFNRLLVDTTAGDASITGIAAGDDGQICIVTNQGPGLLTLVDGGVGSLVANRLYGVTDVTNPSKGSMLLQYSATLTKWVMV